MKSMIKIAKAIAWLPLALLAFYGIGFVLYWLLDKAINSL